MFVDLLGMTAMQFLQLEFALQGCEGQESCFEACTGAADRTWQSCACLY